MSFLVRLPETLGRLPHLAALSLASLLVAAQPGPAAAQDDKLKDLLGRAQQGLDAKAVEDLVGKLEGKPKAPGQPNAVAAPPAATPPAPPKSFPSLKSAVPAPAPPATEPPKAAAPAAVTAPLTPPASPPAAPTPPPVAPVIAIPPPAALPTAPPAIPPPPAVATPAPPATVPTAAQPLPPPTPPVAPAAPANAGTAQAEADRQQLPSVDLDVPFAFNSAEIGPAALPVLALLGKALSDPRLSDATFLIAGHTDAKGRDDYNMRLSQQRADAVRVFLVKSYGIDMRRLAAQGFGETRLKNPRQPQAEENRRVQIINTTMPAAR